MLLYWALYYVMYYVFWVHPTINLIYMLMLGIYTTYVNDDETYTKTTQSYTRTEDSAAVLWASR